MSPRVPLREGSKGCNSNYFRIAPPSAHIVGFYTAVYEDLNRVLCGVFYKAFLKGFQTFSHTPVNLVKGSVQQVATKSGFRQQQSFRVS